MANTETFTFIRLIPRDTEFLQRRIGSRGEIFLDRDTGSIRFFDGERQGGVVLGRTDLANTDVNALENLVNQTGSAFISYTVTIENQGEGNKYLLNGEYQPKLNFVAGYTYEFNQDDPTNVYYPNDPGTTNNQHPLNFSADDLNGELGDGSVYTSGVTYLLDNTAVDKQGYWNGFETATTRRVQIKVTIDTPNILYYWCQNHQNMGNEITVDVPGTGSGAGSSITTSSTAPEEPENGNLWFNSDSGKLYVYYDDGNTSQWVQPTVPATDAFSGNFDDLSNTPTTISGYGITDAFSGNFDDLSNTPTTISGYGITDSFSGSYLDLTDKPTQLFGVDIIGSDSTVLVDAQTSIIVGPAQPASLQLPRLTQSEINALVPEFGTIIYNTTTGKFQGYAEDANNDSTAGWADLH